MKQHVVDQGCPEEFTRLIPWLKESPISEALPRQVINPQTSVRLKKGSTRFIFCFLCSHVSVSNIDDNQGRKDAVNMVANIKNI